MYLSKKAGFFANEKSWNKDLLNSFFPMLSLRRPIYYVSNSTTDIFMNNVVIRDLPMSGKQKYHYDTNASINFRILCPERLTLV